MPNPPDNASRPDSLKSLQTAFAAHIRDPQGAKAPEGVEDRRMNIYRELFFNNISSLLAGNFPVLRALYDDDGWNRLVRTFYIEHRCHTPLFPEVPREFLRYLQDERKERDDDPPFLHELAHYEWVELALSLDEREIDAVSCDPEGDLMDEPPVFSPLAWPLSYRFPVHRIKPDFRPSEAPGEATHLLVYRDRSDQVRFMQLNPVSRLLIALAHEHPDKPGRELLQEVARRIGHPDTTQVIEAGKSLLESFRRKSIVLGSRTG